MLHFRKRNTAFCSASPFTLSATWIRKKSFFLVLKNLSDIPVPTRTLVYLSCKRKPVSQQLIFQTQAHSREGGYSQSYRQGTESKENHHFILPGAQGQPVTDRMAVPRCHLLCIIPCASQSPYSNCGSVIVKSNCKRNGRFPCSWL